MNHITITGRLTRDPDLRQTASGEAVCNLNIAVERRFTSATSEQTADFFDVTCWKGMAESCARNLSKGDKIGVVGDMTSNRYTAADGTSRISWKVTAKEIDFLKIKKFEQPQDEYAEPVNNDELPFY